jgi:hypothetical protein
MSQVGLLQTLCLKSGFFRSRMADPFTEALNYTGNPSSVIKDTHIVGNGCTEKQRMAVTQHLLLLLRLSLN